jgi:hypothetical protein
MLQPNLATSPAMLAMLAACVLAIGFLIRVFVALAGESGAIPVRHKIRPLEIREREGAADPEAYVAMGVLRIATALSSNSGGEEIETTDRSNVVMFAASGRPHDSASQRRYGLS